jgi:hypothetical protein
MYVHRINQCHNNEACGQAVHWLPNHVLEYIQVVVHIV